MVRIHSVKYASCHRWFLSYIIDLQFNRRPNFGAAPPKTGDPIGLGLIFIGVFYEEG